MKLKLPLVIVFLLLLTLTGTSIASAQDPGPEPTPSEDEVNRIAKNLYCPVCENIPLDVCESAACAQWRDQIREKLVEGWTEEQIYDYFVVQYGERVLAEPPRRGLNWLIYIVPPIALLAGGVLLYRLLRKSTRSTPEENVASTGKVKPESTPQDDKYTSLLEEELKKRQ
ncbi:MAG: hypothetical protein FVQ83_08390 [Chloroflexi bacterium]|nr:hypothetical protein [Chloroflexota bacterium]